MSNALIRRDNLILRSQLLKLVRDFFYLNDFTEVCTPIIVKTPALEDHIDAVRCNNHYLRTSPELHMKRLLSADCKRIFQIGSCFRNGEKGRLHNPEFSMLEWYVAGFNYMDILNQTKELVRYVCSNLLNNQKFTYGEQTINVGEEWEQLTVENAFTTFTDKTVGEAMKNNQFEELLTDEIEPEFSPDRATVLIDFPIELGALARASKSNSKLAERWELYIGGLEIANAYSELIDHEEQLRRFINTAELRKKNNREVYPIDEDFIRALKYGLPECAGCALGVDRFLMILSNRASIDEVISFYD